MSEQVRERELSRSLHAFLSDEDGARRYRRMQQLARSGNAGGAERARPMQFDESGFPLAQRNSSFLQRVARLLSPL